MKSPHKGVLGDSPGHPGHQKPSRISGLWVRHGAWRFAQ